MNRSFSRNALVGGGLLTPTTIGARRLLSSGRGRKTPTYEDRKGSSAGQAMVEFAFLLLLLLILCSGMLFQSRLLSIHYWAQQEARYLTFEQTWVPNSARANSLQTSKNKLNDGDYFRRPKLFDDLDVNRQGTSSGSVSDLALNVTPPADSSTAPGEEAPIMLARHERSIWNRRTSEWTEAIEGTFSLIATAFASQEFPSRQGKRGTFFPQVSRKEFLWDASDLPVNPLERAIVKKLRNAGVGQGVCDAFEQVLSRYDAKEQFPQLSGRGCPKMIDRDFGVHLARNVDFPQVFREYGYQLEWGLDSGAALEETVEREISGQFYSFFDELVKGARTEFVVDGFRAVQGITFLDGLADASIGRMIAQLRYVGSSAAIGILTGVIPAIGSLPEDDIRDIVNVDAANLFQGIGNGFLLNPTYLPVPPTFGGGGPAMFDAVMENVMWLDEDQFGPLIDQQNKSVTVTYKPDNGLFPAATQRFAWKNRTMASTFVLVTEPWHIPRRESPLGAYRQLGDQKSLNDEPSDEGILRRRVSGLYMFPKRPGAFLKPLTEIPELEFLSPITSIFDTVDDAFSTIASLLEDSVLTRFLNGLKDIPLIRDLVPIPPPWPAVRPQAYPRTEEIKNDRSVRDREDEDADGYTFEDFIEDQKHNPPPKPDFHDPG